MDTGQDIIVPDEMTLPNMIELEADTQGRFSFLVDISGKFAVCYWVNFVQPRTKDTVKQCWKLLPQQSKKVVII